MPLVSQTSVPRAPWEDPSLGKPQHQSVTISSSLTGSSLLTGSKGSTMGNIGLQRLTIGDRGTAGTLTITQIAQRLIDGDQPSGITLHKRIHTQLVQIRTGLSS